MSSPHHYFLELKRRFIVAKTIEIQKAEMLLQGVLAGGMDNTTKKNIFRYLIRQGMSEDKITYYLENQRWPKDQGGRIAETAYENLRDERILNINKPISHRAKRAFRNVVVLSVILVMGLATVFFIASTGDKEKKAEVSIEETTSTGQDGDAL